MHTPRILISHSGNKAGAPAASSGDPAEGSPGSPAAPSNAKKSPRTVSGGGGRVIQRTNMELEGPYLGPNMDFMSSTWVLVCNHKPA